MDLFLSYVRNHLQLNLNSDELNIHFHEENKINFNNVMKYSHCKVYFLDKGWDLMNKLKLPSHII